MAQSIFQKQPREQSDDKLLLYLKEKQLEDFTIFLRKICDILLRVYIDIVVCNLFIEAVENHSMSAYETNDKIARQELPVSSETFLMVNDNDSSYVVPTTAASIDRRVIQQQKQQPQNTSSIPKIMTKLLAIPTNRSCADCKSSLVDTSQIYASFSPNHHLMKTTTDNVNDTNNEGIVSTNPFNDIPSLKKIPKKTKNTTTTRQSHFDKRHLSFQTRHAAFKPTADVSITSTTNTTHLHHHRHDVPVLKEWSVDPAISAGMYCNHGVFVCAVCAAAHQLLKRTTTIVRSVMDTHSWTIEDVQLLHNAGGNARATTVLEAYFIPPSNNNSVGVQRPTSSSTIEERLFFIRAKYEALAFILPNPSTSAGQRVSQNAWENILQLHPEWDGLWGANLRQPGSTYDILQQDGDKKNNLWLNPSLNQTSGMAAGWGTSSSTVNTSQQPASTLVLPNRLIDYFCVVTASDFLHASMQKQDLSTSLVSPEDILLTPSVSDCIPSPDFYTNNNSYHEESKSSNACENSAFPEHISTFIYPDGCTPSLTQLPPMFFTLVLTNSSGERLYGGVLRLYDDSCDTVEKVTKILHASNYPLQKYPSWLPKKKNIVSPTFLRSSSLETSPTNSNTSRPSSLRNLKSSKSERVIIDTSEPALPISDVMFLPKSLVILSHYPFFDIFRKFLLHIYRIALTEAPLPIERFVTNFVCEVPLPPPGKIQVKFSFTIDDCWTIERPPVNQLPMANFSYRPLFTCLSIPNILVVMGCLLQETRIVLLSKHYAILGPTSEALLSLLFPFHWQGMYLPILPYSMLEILDAPVPYVVGLHSRYLEETSMTKRPRGVVLVDLDRDEVHLGYDDQVDIGPRRIPSLPDRHATKLRTKLLEVASSAYVVPNSQRVGYISTGHGVSIPSSNREPYAQTVEVPNNGLLRRRDVLPQTDKAFRDNELLVPISGFLSEQGQLYQQNDQVDTLDKKPQKFPFVMTRLLKSPSDTAKAVFANGEQKEANVTNLLDIEDPPGFNTAEIRQAFLRFFTSLFQTYRMCLVEKGSFRSDDFLSGLNLTEKSTEFVRGILSTQMFQSFTEERRENPDDPEVRFFDDSITAKLNRSKKVVLTGRKKETAFLDDTRSMVTETYSPPPPNNFGLPDDGRSYQYSTFPKLNSDLFGKIRPPKKWNNQDLRQTLRTSTRRSSVAARINEQAVVEKASRSLLLSDATKRKSRNLDNALKVLSSPFSAVPTRQRVAQDSNYRRAQEISAVNRDRSESVFSNVTLPSEFDFTTDCDAELTTAEEIVLNARRKQAILIGIISKFQAECRKYLERKRSNEPMPKVNCSLQSNTGDRNRIAARFIQRWILSRLLRKEFCRTKKLVVRMQARRRGIAFRTAYKLLLHSLKTLQALCRGFLARRILFSLAKDRMIIYQRQIFALWNSAYTPLSYRARFWTIFDEITFLRLKIAELELERLWKEMKIPIFGGTRTETAVQRAGISLGSPFGTAHIIYQNALRENIQPKIILKSSKSKTRPDDSLGSDRVAAERTQFYERLSSLSEDSMNKVISRLAIPASEKKKKVFITDLLWKTYDDADQSSNLMIEICPELLHSTDIYFLVPSKKALRRFPCIDALPRPLPFNLQAHQLLPNRVRMNLAEIADNFLRRVPQLLESSSSRRSKSIQKELQVKRIAAFVHRKAFPSESDARVAFMRRTLWKMSLSQCSNCMRNRAKDSSSSKLSESHVATLASTSTGHILSNHYDFNAPVTVPKSEPLEQLDENSLRVQKQRGTREISMKMSWMRR